MLHINKHSKVKGKGYTSLLQAICNKERIYFSSWKLRSNTTFRNTLYRFFGHLSANWTITHTYFTRSFLEAASITPVHATP
jgi:hypothetical protein